MTKFQKAIRREPQTTPPIWFMRQAGRYHKHYQAIRAKHEFIEMCKNPDLAAEVTMGPIDDFDYDVAILFSDLLFPLEALGLGLRYEPGPKLDVAVSPENIGRLRPVREALADLAFQGEALRKIRQRLPQDKSLIGFVGGPWTLFTYAISPMDQNRPEFFSANAIASKRDMEFFAQFSEVLLELLVSNIQLQIDGGAEVVMIFDPAAGVLSADLFKKFVAPDLAKISARFSKRVAYYSKETNLNHLSPHILNDSNWAGVGVDHRMNVPDVLRLTKSGFVQGNFDQALLFAEPDVLKKRLIEYLAPYRDMDPSQRAGWVCGLGHGVLPQTPEANVKLFIETVRTLFR
jgi:uroporphyrinogen decarboxylase